MNLEYTSNEKVMVKDSGSGVFYSLGHARVLDYLTSGEAISDYVSPTINQAQKDIMLERPLQDKLFQQEKLRLAQLAVDGGDSDQQISIDSANITLGLLDAKITDIKGL